MFRLIGTALLGAFCAAAIQADTIQSTFSSWDGSTVAYSFANDGNGENFGQTITVPTDGNNVLSFFTFTLEDSSGPAIPFHAVVSAWDGTASFVGAPLFSFSAQTLIVADFAYDAYTFYPNVPLTSGGLYILALIADPSATPSHEPLAAEQPSAGDAYTGGDRVFGAGTASPWNTSVGSDTVFTADFTSSTAPTVPEPGTLGMLFAALALGATVASKGRRATMKWSCLFSPAPTRP